MPIFGQVLEFAIQHAAIVTTLLFLLSELIGESESLKASSVFGFIRNFLKGESQKVFPEIDKVVHQPLKK